MSAAAAPEVAPAIASRYEVTSKDLDADDVKLINDIRETVGQNQVKLDRINFQADKFQDQTKACKARILECRQKIFRMHEQRGVKQNVITRNEFEMKQIEGRLKTLEENIEHSRNSLRLEHRAPDTILKAQKNLKSGFETNQEANTRVMRLLRRRDHVIAQLHLSIEKENKYRERIQGLMDRLKVQIDKQDKLKLKIVTKVENIKKLHQDILEMEPKLRQSHTQMRRVEVVCFDLEDKINRRREEYTKLRDEIAALEEEKEQSKVKYEIKHGKGYKGINARENLLGILDKPTK